MGRVSLEKPSFFSMGFNNSVYPFICIYDPRAELCVHFSGCAVHGWCAVPLYFGPLLAAMRARAGIIDIFPI
jgi:hypothetical protein